MMDTRLIFENLKTAIDEACRDKGLNSIYRTAQALGLRETQTEARSQVLLDFGYEDSDGSSVKVTARWFDPSGPFQNVPDITRIRLVLRRPGEHDAEYSREYDD